MHELALARELLTIIERVALEHELTSPVTIARLELGAMSCVEPRALCFAFEAVRTDSIAPACELQIERLPLVVRCRGCDYSGGLTPTRDAGSDNLRGISAIIAESTGCPICGDASLEVVSGREMRLVSIDVEEESNHA